MPAGMLDEHLHGTLLCNNNVPGSQLHLFKLVARYHDALEPFSGEGAQMPPYIARMEKEGQLPSQANLAALMACVSKSEDLTPQVADDLYKPVWPNGYKRKRRAAQKTVGRMLEWYRDAWRAAGEDMCDLEKEYAGYCDMIERRLAEADGEDQQSDLLEEDAYNNVEDHSEAHKKTPRPKSKGKQKQKGRTPAA